MPGPQNKTVTFTASTAVVGSMEFNRNPANPAGPIMARVRGQVSLSDGSIEQISTLPFVLSGAVETAVRNLMDGGALTRLRTDNGIEAP